ncbi:MAG: hypothetical protein HRU20_09905 [Pseudomonadales bacterium]|nr:hypothetical protein [Pseudomonadales bacterium]
MFNLSHLAKILFPLCLLFLLSACGSDEDDVYIDAKSTSSSSGKLSFEIVSSEPALVINNVIQEYEVSITAREIPGDDLLTIEFDTESEVLITSITWTFPPDVTTWLTPKVIKKFDEPREVRIRAVVQTYEGAFISYLTIKVFDPNQAAEEGGLSSEEEVVSTEQLSNLVVNSFAMDTELTPGGLETLSAIIQNVGDGDLKAEGYLRVGYYLSTDQTITVDDIFIGETSILVSDYFTQSDVEFGFESLSPQQNYQYDHQLLIPANIPAGSYYVAAFVDDLDVQGWLDFPRATDTVEYTFPSPYVVVDESDESDNIRVLGAYQVTVANSPCDDDSFEAGNGDDVSTDATVINVSDTQLHNFCFDNADWLKFDAVAGQVYKISAQVSGINSNTQLFLYDRDASTALLFNDDIGTHPSSEIVWEAQFSGTYFIKVRNVSSAGLDTDYRLSLNVSTISQKPNLVVSSFAIDDEVTPGKLETISAIIQNIGSSPLEGSCMLNVGYYLSTDSTITVDDIYIGDTSIIVGDAFSQGDIGFGFSSLSPMQNYQYVHQLAVKGNIPSGTYYAGAIVDYIDVYEWYVFPRAIDTFEYAFPVFCTVDESIETDNVRVISSPLVTVDNSVCVDDGFESDDSSVEATLISDGDMQSHNFCFDNSDWLKFDAVAGIIYKFTAQVAGIEADPQLILYDTDATSLLLFHDNIGNGATTDLASGSGASAEIVWEAQTSGTYFIKVRTASCDEDLDNNCDTSADGVGLNSEYRISFNTSENAAQMVNLVVDAFAINNEIIIDNDLLFLTDQDRTDQIVTLGVAGDTVTISATIQNIGGKLLSGDGRINVGYYLSTDKNVTVDDIFIGDTSIFVGDAFPNAEYRIDSLAALQSYQYNHQLSVKNNIPTGTYYAAAIVDYVDELDWYDFPRLNDLIEYLFPEHTVIEESNENDNTLLFNQTLIEIDDLVKYQVAVTNTTAVPNDVCIDDAFETDDNATDATLIVSGDVQLHNFCFDNADWIKFDAIKDHSYRITTANIASVQSVHRVVDVAQALIPADVVPKAAEADTQLILYDENAEAILLFHDNIGNRYVFDEDEQEWTGDAKTVDLDKGTPVNANSEIVWQAASTATYFIKVRTTTCDEDLDAHCSQSPDGVGLATEYTISFEDLSL